MNPEIPKQDMTPDEAMASLAFATKLSDDTFFPDNGSETPENDPGSMETPETPVDTTQDILLPKIEEMEARMMKRMDEIESKISDSKKDSEDSEIESLKGELNKIINEDE